MVPPQLESSLRVSQREVRALEEALRAARGVEGDGVIKSSKAEEGACGVMVCW